MTVVRTVYNVPGIARLSSAELRQLDRAAKAVPMHVDCLAWYISAESGWNPRAGEESGQDAVGLGQLTKFARGKLTRQQVLDMSISDQLTLVARHFRGLRNSGNLNDCDRARLTSFFPEAGKADEDFVIAAPDGRTDSKVISAQTSKNIYAQNEGLDVNRFASAEQLLTVGDVLNSNRFYREDNAGRGRIEIPGAVETEKALPGGAQVPGPRDTPTRIPQSLVPIGLAVGGALLLAVFKSNRRR